MEIKCPFWAVCGAASVHDYWAKQTFLSRPDPRRDYIAMVCNDENRYLECEHYKIRTKPKERKMKLGEIFEDLCIWAKHRKPGIITFLVQLAVWVVGGIFIIFVAVKEFCEKWVKK